LYHKIIATAAKLRNGRTRKDWRAAGAYAFLAFGQHYVLGGCCGCCAM
jgi:hypothetical protein